jgi:hypothetical protein
MTEPAVNIPVILNVDTSFAGYVQLPGVSYDVAAPQQMHKLPVPGTYQLVRIVDISDAVFDITWSYGHSVLFFVNTKTSQPLVIHGGVTDANNDLFHPDEGLAMNNRQLDELTHMFAGEKEVEITISHEDIGWLRKKFRNRISRRPEPRFAPVADCDMMLDLSLRRAKQQWSCVEDDITGDHPLYWITLYGGAYPGDVREFETYDGHDQRPAGSFPGPRVIVHDGGISTPGDRNLAIPRNTGDKPPGATREI